MVRLVGLAIASELGRTEAIPNEQNGAILALGYRQLSQTGVYAQNPALSETEMLQQLSREMSRYL